MFGFSRRRNKRSVSAISLEERVLPAAVNVQMTPVGRNTFDVRFTGGHADESISVYRDESNNLVAFGRGGTTFVVNGQPFNRPLELGTVRNMTFFMAGGNDSVDIEDLSATSLMIDDGGSPTETNDYRIRSRLMNSSIGEVSGALFGGHFDLLFETSTNRTLTIGRINIGTGHLESSSIAFLSRNGLLNVTGTTRIHHESLSGGHDTVRAMSETTTTVPMGEVRFGGLVTYTPGAGHDALIAKGNVDFRGGLRVDMAGGNDSLQIAPDSQNPLAIQSPKIRGTQLNVVTGAGDDTVQIGGSSASQDRLTLYRGATIDTGSGNDTVDMGRTDNLAGLTVRLGTHTAIPGGDTVGGDVLSLRGVSTRSTSRIESQGLARVSLTGDISAATRFSSAVTFALGSGGVTVGMATAASRVVFGGTHTFQGITSPISVQFLGFVQRNGNQILRNAVVI